ncbi:DUF4232 domain-containing protein [Streptomyces sp. NPDC058145]|uniref:DUF4232 domain-containing protein n=1 Tax=Streptomyces sp. NPDC058145 TaxID=3346356 RepID=UPI0036F1602B
MGGGTSASGSGAASTRCTTSELRGNVGDNNPGAGQESFPLIVTNFSDHTCTLYGYPGAAFVDGSGKQLGPDPKRVSESAGAANSTKITLAPGKSAWGGLSFGNPDISGTCARQAEPHGGRAGRHRFGGPAPVIRCLPPDDQWSVVRTRARTIGRSRAGLRGRCP